MSIRIGNLASFLFRAENGGTCLGFGPVLEVQTMPHPSGRTYYWFTAPTGCAADLIVGVNRIRVPHSYVSACPLVGTCTGCGAAIYVGIDQDRTCRDASGRTGDADHQHTDRPALVTV